MRIFIISFSGHRIDELLADLAAKALRSIGVKVVRCFPSKEELTKDNKILIFNGITEETEHCAKAYKCMVTMDSYYFIDDHTTWVPGPEDCKHIVTQFSNLHPLYCTKCKEQEWLYWPISRLGALLPKQTEDEYSKEFGFVYWGHYKEERKEEYARLIPKTESTLIIGNKEEWPKKFHRCAFLPYTRDMNVLYANIARGTRTAIFGDKYHNGCNLPLRYYEALACNLTIYVSPELADKEDFKIYKANKIGEQLMDLLKCEQVKTAQHNSSDVDEVLENRGQIYGRYSDGVACRASILDALETTYGLTHNYEPLPSDLRVMYSDLVLKLMRSASDPSHLDSWVDLAGYAKLIKNTMEGTD